MNPRSFLVDFILLLLSLVSMLACANTPAGGGVVDAQVNTDGGVMTTDAGEVSVDGGVDSDAGTSDAGGCADPLSMCAGMCVDTDVDSAHCGQCNLPCTGSDVCVNGMCTPPDDCLSALGVPCDDITDAYLKASNPDIADEFHAVAIDGDTIAVGAFHEDSNARGVDGNQDNDVFENSGAVYVFVRSGGTWVQQAYIKASNADDGDEFGFHLALDGDTLAVAATREDGPGEALVRAGAVYVYRRNNDIWSFEAMLRPEELDGDDIFGVSIALDGDTLAIGAMGEDSASTGVNGDQRDNSMMSTGAAYVFRRSGTAWTQEAYLKAHNPGDLDRFGNSIALYDDRVVVGAWEEDGSANTIDGADDDDANAAGAAYVFVRNGSTWTQEAYLKAPNAEPGDLFGYRVAIGPDRLVVTARDEASSATGVDGDTSDNSALVAGAAYVFVRDGSGWRSEAYLKASNTEGGDRFGSDVAMDGDTIVIGAFGEAGSQTGGSNISGTSTTDDLPGAGAVYIFKRTAASWSHAAYLKASNPGSNDGFGVRVALSNNTCAVGARFESSSATGVGGDQTNDDLARSGAVYVLRVGP